jgi:D-alanyl-D-alanine carboxypeptidase
MIDARIQGMAFEAPATFDPKPAPKVAAAPAPAPAKPAKKSAIPREALSGWLIQVGAVDSEAAANRLLDKAKSKAGKALAGAAPVTESVEKGSQTFVRARFAGFDSQKAAQRACAALKKSDMSCFALRL